MKVLLVEPPVSPFDVPTGNAMLPPAHHLERLAGTILQNHDVEIIDMRIDKTEKDLTERIKTMCQGLTSVLSLYQTDRQLYV